VRDYLREALDRARNVPGFADRLRDRIEQDKPVLDRLERLEHEEANRVVDAVMSEIRRLATHEHRYPQLNNQGFPVNQCLDCGRWRDAE
jgi:hypothetical protein